MATMNPFDLLGDDDNDDPSHLIAVHQQKIAAKKPSASASASAAAAPLKAPAKLPTKPLPPTQAVREARSNTAPSRGGGGGRGRGGRGRGTGAGRDFGNGNVEGFGGPYGGGGGRQDGGEVGKGGSTKDRGSYGAPHQSYGGGGYRQHTKDGENAADERPLRRQYERKSGTGRGNEFIKREGSGRGNWGTATDDVIAQDSVEVINVEDKVSSPEKQLDKEITHGSDTNKEGAAKESEIKEEDKEMTLEEYEKIREEKRKALLSMKAKERKVDLDKDLKSMQQLSIKKGNDDIFIKLDSDKDLKKQKADRDEKAKKSVSINEFLKPAEGEKYYSSGSRGGRGRGRGSFRGGRSGDSVSTTTRTEAVIKIEDPGQFPTLGGK